MLLRWHVLRRWNVRQPPAQIRQQQGYLACGGTQHVAQIVGWHGANELLENLCTGNEGRAVFLVGMSGQRQHSVRVAQEKSLFTQTRLAGAGLTADQYHAATAGGRVFQPGSELRHFLCAADQRRGLGA